jgi:2-methylcitrate dehydratase PrpD
MQKSKPDVSPLMQKFSTYVAGAGRAALPAEVREKAKQHIIDTLAAIISGTRLMPGAAGVSYARTQGGVEEAGVPGTSFVTTAANAAFASGMAAHADETDDSHQPSNTHPGCAVVPAALATAERERCSGILLIKAVTAGYDADVRLTLALDQVAFKIAGFSNHSFGGLFGATVAAAVATGLNARQVRHALSYATHQLSGLRTFERDGDHILKAFDFGGMTARNGVSSVAMVKHGFTGVEDEFAGPRNRNLFDAYSPTARPQEMIKGLGQNYEIMRTNIKKWSVGSPNQASLDALEWLMERHQLTAGDVQHLIVTTPDNEAKTVDNSLMPDICMQHLLALMLADGTVTFDSCHDLKRMRDPKLLALRKRMELVASEELTKARPRRQAIVEIHTHDGRKLKRRTRIVRGNPENPMPRSEVDSKCLDLIAPVIGKRQARRLIDAIWSLEKLPDVRKLRALYRE